MVVIRRVIFPTVTSLFPLQLPSTMWLLYISLSALLTACQAFNSPMSPPTETLSDLAIVGMGVLGTSLAGQLLSHPHFQHRTITGITQSPTRHDDIRNQLKTSNRLVLTTMDQLRERGDHGRFQDLVFCAPPSGFDNYAQALREAATLLWSNSSENGSFLFTSSGGVYAPSEGEIVNEASPTMDPVENARQGRLIFAERECLAVGGCVLRLAGLYTLERGPHNYWLMDDTKGEEKGQRIVRGREDGIINLLHYEDAARACLAALLLGRKENGKKVFLISDGNPMTKKEICESALKHQRYLGHCQMPRFVSEAQEKKGKIYDGSWSNEQLKWRPTYVSFDEFMTKTA